MYNAQNICSKLIWLIRMDFTTPERESSLSACRYHLHMEVKGQDLQLKSHPRAVRGLRSCSTTLDPGLAIYRDISHWRMSTRPVFPKIATAQLIPSISFKKYIFSTDCTHFHSQPEILNNLLSWLWHLWSDSLDLVPLRKLSHRWT